LWDRSDAPGVPSRRALLRAATGGAAGAVAGLAGCLGPDRVSGYVQLKAVVGVVVEDGVRADRTVLRVSLGSPPGGAPPDVDFRMDRWADAFASPRRPVVGPELADRLRRAYEQVRYVVGVCSPAWADDGEPVGCVNADVAREAFDRVQVHDEVTASWDGSTLRIHDVDGTWTFEG